MESSICVAVITGHQRIAGFQDDLFLHDGNFFRAHLHAQVAARDHHAVGDSENFVEIVYGFGLFQFGDHRRVFSGARDGVLGGADVGGGAHEAQRQVISADSSRRRADPCGPSGSSKECRVLCRED